MNEPEKLFVVQETMLPQSEEPPDLFCRFAQTARPIDADAPQAATDNAPAGTIGLNAGGHLSFNTYFNSFYLEYWQRHTEIGRLYIRFELSGQLCAEVYRALPHAVPDGIAGMNCQGTGETIVIPVQELARFRRSGGGRIYLKLEAATDCVIANLAFATDRPPPRRARVTLGICAFGKEEYLADTVRQVARTVAERRDIAKVFIVNQGAPFSNRELLATLDACSAFEVIEQPNQGGCGGFTRTIMEAMRTKGVTHHLLCDDDVVINPAVIGRAITFLNYAKLGVALGGHMLDRLRKTCVHEAGATIAATNTLVPNAHDHDVCNAEALDVFNGHLASDYNAWWFWVVPLNVVEQLKLPLPLFIRGDDIEYGVRLAEAGIVTVSLPGVAVWHEPFYARPVGWQVYYDMRNRLILASIYPHRFELDRPFHILAALIGKCATHGYMESELLVMAVSDFLKGSDRLFASPPSRIHARATETADRLRPADLDWAEGTRRGWVTIKRHDPGGFARQSLDMVWFYVKSLCGPGSKRHPRLVLDRDVHVSNTGIHAYVRTNSVASCHQVFQPNRKRLAVATLRAVSIFALYALRRRIAAANWNRQATRHMEWDAWERILETAPRESKSPIEPAVCTDAKTGGRPDRP